LGNGWWPNALADFLKLTQDENGNYIISEDKTTVYGYGDTPVEALCDYIISLIEYAQILLSRTEASQCLTERPRRK
jgi:hypothetical protein